MDRVYRTVGEGRPSQPIPSPGTGHVMSRTKDCRRHRGSVDGCTDKGRRACREGSLPAGHNETQRFAITIIVVQNVFTRIVIRFKL